MLFKIMKDTKDLFVKLRGDYMNVKNMRICLDPVVDFECQKNIFNSIEDEQSVSLRVDKGKSFSTDNPLRSFYFDADFQIKVKKTSVGYEKAATDDVEIFCIEELKNKIPNCQVYFNNQSDFIVTKST